MAGYTQVTVGLLPAVLVLITVLNCMTIWAECLEVSRVIVSRVTVKMVYVQDLWMPLVAATLAPRKIYQSGQLPSVFSWTWFMALLATALLTVLRPLALERIRFESSSACNAYFRLSRLTHTRRESVTLATLGAEFGVLPVRRSFKALIAPLALVGDTLTWMWFYYPGFPLVFHGAGDRAKALWSSSMPLVKARMAILTFKFDRRSIILASPHRGIY